MGGLWLRFSSGEIICGYGDEDEDMMIEKRVIVFFWGIIL